METLSKLFKINLATILTETLNFEKACKLKIQTVWKFKEVVVALFFWASLNATHSFKLHFFWP